MLKQISLLEPHRLQKEILLDNHRFRVLSCGRRWGKSILAMRGIFEMIYQKWVQTRKQQRGWIVAPTFPLVREDWMLAEQVLKDAITDKKITDMRMDLDPFGFIEFKSAEREDEGLRGAGIDFCVVDEASRVSRKSWEMGIRPALSDKEGKCIFISTPKGRNWFYELYVKGQSPNEEIKSWQHPTFSNPFFPQLEWNVILETTPELILRQEYYADFLEDDATVFKNLSKCLRGSLEIAQPDKKYSIGIDLGKSIDWTVITVIRESDAQLVHIYRINKVDWSLQKQHIKMICSQYRNALCYIDSTGLGDPIEEDLRNWGINTRGFKFSNSSKQQLIERLIVTIEQGLIGIPDCSATKFLIEELKAFTYEILPSARLRYTAPEGLHDDGIMSLALALSGMSYALYKKQEEKKTNLPKNSPAELERRWLEDLEKRNQRLPRRLRRNIETILSLS